MPNYKKTKTACYLGVITQAIAANFAPLLFLKFHYDYHMIRESKGYLYFILLAIGTLKTEYVAVNFQKC